MTYLETGFVTGPRINETTAAHDCTAAQPEACLCVWRQAVEESGVLESAVVQKASHVTSQVAGKAAAVAQEAADKVQGAMSTVFNHTSTSHFLCLSLSPFCPTSSTPPLQMHATSSFLCWMHCC